MHHSSTKHSIVILSFLGPLVLGLTFSSPAHAQQEEPAAPVADAEAPEPAETEQDETEEPEAAEAEPETAEPAPAAAAEPEPESAEPESAEPESAEPESAEPNPAEAAEPEPESAEPTDAVTLPETSPLDPPAETSEPPAKELPPGTLPTSPVDLGSARYVPGKGLAIESQDGDFALITRLRAQFRYSWFHDSNGEDEQFFQIRRARLQFKGNMWGEHNRFKVEIAISPQDVDREPVGVGRPMDGMNVPDHTHPTAANVVTTTALLDWYMTFDHLRDLTLRIGQYKVPYNRQRVVSSGNLQFVDRAITNAQYTVDRDLGMDLRSKDFLGLDMLRYYAGLYIGEGANTSSDTLGAGDFGFMYIGRVEVLPFGMFDDYSEADFAHTDDFRLSIGAAYAYVSDAPGIRGIQGSTPPGEMDTHNLTADVMAKYDGFSLFSDVFWRKGQGLPDQQMPNGVGFMVQGGYVLESLPLEFAARYGMLRPVGDSSLISENEAGGAISYYFAQHPFKIQADYFRLWNETFGFDDGIDRVRVQMQASF